MSDTTTDVDKALKQASAAAKEGDGRKKKLTMIVMSGDLDKLFGAFTIATGAAAMDMDVVMFFTFWGMRAIRRADAKTGTSFFGRMLGKMYGGGIEKANPSKFSFGGLGRWMFGKMMGSHNVVGLVQLRDMAVKSGVKMYGCTTSMEVMETPKEAFIPEVQGCVGVGFFLDEAQDSQITLFI